MGHYEVRVLCERHQGAVTPNGLLSILYIAQSNLALHRHRLIKWHLLDVLDRHELGRGDKPSLLALPLGSKH